MRSQTRTGSLNISAWLLRLLGRQVSPTLFATSLGLELEKEDDRKKHRLGMIKNACGVSFRADKDLPN